jgi:hypothetical protein
MRHGGSKYGQLHFIVSCRWEKQPAGAPQLPGLLYKTSEPLTATSYIRSHPLSYLEREREKQRERQRQTLTLRPTDMPTDTDMHAHAHARTHARSLSLSPSLSLSHTHTQTDRQTDRHEREREREILVKASRHLLLCLRVGALVASTTSSHSNRTGLPIPQIDRM